MPNFIAYAALIAWPLASLVLFAALPARVALVVCLVGGEMFLPPNFSIDLPLIPPLNKDLVASLSALLGCLMFKPRALRQKAPGGRYNWLFLLLAVGALFTTLTNGDPLQYGPVHLPGQTIHDFISDAILLLLAWWTPFYLGRKLFCHSEDLRVLLHALVVGGLIYTFFIFIEIRLSPQFNMWIYGYHQSEFAQTVRFGAYRPKVFMRHGLNVALFILMALMASAALRRARVKVFRVGATAWTIYLAVVLLLCRSTGAVIYALAFLPLLMWARPRLQARVAMVVAIVVFAYPMLRTWDWVPVDGVISFFKSAVGDERAQSLQFRLVNEQTLLRHAVERPWFGWGGYARSFVFDRFTGKQATVVDGFWIAVLGATGIVGFVSIFGLLLLPIIRFGRVLRTMSGEERYAAAGVLILSVIYVVDLIPNAGVGPYLTMMLGCLAGMHPQVPQPLGQEAYGNLNEVRGG
ncbi:MAG: hypothetical protein SF187_13515 [Deltaproteobacteria bacterium]|nr:hypothetical protein [Deltaproteobacteria bacterium]